MVTSSVLGLLAALAASSLALGAGTPSAPELTSAQERLDGISARIAQVRTLSQGAGPQERRLRAAQMRRLVERKRALSGSVAGLQERVIAEERAAAREARRRREAAPPPPPQPTAVPVTATGGPPDPALAVQTQAIAPAGGDMAPALDAYLAARLSPLTGHGAVFVREAGAVGLDPRLLVAIAGAETAFGAYGPSQAILNPFGMGPGIQYASWEESIGAAARNLAGHLYLGDGRVTIAAIQQRWAPSAAANDPTGLNLNWTVNVSRFYAELGGAGVQPGAKRARERLTEAVSPCRALRPQAARARRPPRARSRRGRG